MILQRAGLRHLLHHPLPVAMAVLGVALGVAVAVGIDLANGSAERAFHLSARSLTGRATHQVLGGPGGLDEAAYRRLRLEAGVRASAPVVEGYAVVPGRSELVLQIMGIDPLAEEPFRDFSPAVTAGADLGRLLTEPGAALLLPETARLLGLKTGDRLPLDVGGVARELVLAGEFEVREEGAAATLETLVVTDIATAQEVFGTIGRLSRIDLRMPAGPEGEQVLARVRAVLPPAAAVLAADSRGEAMDRMSRAFRLNLTALSLLALVVGTFLIYNTMVFSVLRRRPALGILRTLGATRGQVFRLILGEAALIGTVGTAFGLLLGWALGSVLLQLVTRTINDLYFVVAVRDVAVTPWSLGKGAVLGVGAAIGSALIPAREAMAAPPGSVLSRSALEQKARRNLPRAAVAGIVLIAVAGILLLVPGRGITISFVALFAIIAGYALLTPAAAVLLLRLGRPVLDRSFGILGRLAARTLTASLSRTGVATAALVVAVSATVGVGLMVDSFRITLERWLADYLRADIYLTTAAAGFGAGRVPLAPGVVENVAALPEVAAVTRARHVTLPAAAGAIDLMVADLPPATFAGYDFRQGDREAIRDAVAEGAILVSEPFAYHRRLEEGDSLRLRTDRGEHDFFIAGVFTDFGSDRGRVVMERATFERFWGDRAIDSLGIYLTAGADTPAMVEKVRQAAAGRQEVTVRSNRALREFSMATFDRTFAVTSVLRLLAVLVAFVGIVNALTAMQVERARELAVLRAAGLTSGRLWALVTGETGLIGALAGLLALPLGAIQALFLVLVVNRRSFGWTMPLRFDAEILLQAVVLAMAAALLAGLLPAWRMARTPPALALREE